MFTKRVNVFVLYHVFGKTFCLISFTCREVENTRRVMCLIVKKVDSKRVKKDEQEEL